jgi:AbrB family looped-hinge helix DNA binding protein
MLTYHCYSTIFTTSRADNQKNGFDKWFNPHYNTSMETRLVMDKAGRVVIPKSLRKEWHLEPGDELELKSGGEEIILRPVRERGLLTKEQGVWVFRTGKPMSASTTDDLLQQIREDRDLANLGERTGDSADKIRRDPE